MSALSPSADGQHLFYFAYGSNLHPHRLQLRVPSSQPVTPAVLPGHQLRFHKRGRDGSGKCNIWRTDNPADRVIGALYRMLAHEKPLLDSAEGLGRGYQVTTFQLRTLATAEQDCPAELPGFCYVAQPDHIDDTLRPFSWYHELVVSGARYHRLPADYIDHIDGIESQPDHDFERHALHQRILRNL